jgi:hypothetical protein
MRWSTRAGGYFQAAVASGPLEGPLLRSMADGIARSISSRLATGDWRAAQTIRLAGSTATRCTVMTVVGGIPRQGGGLRRALRADVEDRRARFLPDAEGRSVWTTSPGSAPTVLVDGRERPVRHVIVVVFLLACR